MDVDRFRLEQVFRLAVFRARPKAEQEEQVRTIGNFDEGIIPTNVLSMFSRSDEVLGVIKIVDKVVVVV